MSILYFLGCVPQAKSAFFLIGHVGSWFTAPGCFATSVLRKTLIYHLRCWTPIQFDQVCFHFFASTTHCFCFKISVPSTCSNHLQVGYISHHLASRAKTPRGFLKIDPGRCMDCWACPACTFENLPTAECCEICEKGRRGQRKTMGNAQEVEKSLKHIEIPFFVDILVCLDIWD